MDGVSSASNEENDNTERTARRRRSSILKPPRSPLQDLRGGNEITQGPSAFRSRKSSRRVSFADTIKVFQTESHMKIEKKSENSETEVGENILFTQNRSPEDSSWKINGMSTLLCAPIQTQMQHREISSTEHNHEMTHQNDQTVIFSDENQMDLTASHTVMITKGLLDCTKSKKSTKIDTTSFLADLRFHTENSKMKKDSMFSFDHTSTSQRKINFNDFKERLEAGKFNADTSTRLYKENLEVPIYSRDLNRTSTTHQKQASLNADENNSNMTNFFREQNDVINFTQCHISNIQTLVPTSNKAYLMDFKGTAETVLHKCRQEELEVTRSHTNTIDCKTVTAKETVGPMDKTVMFVGDHDELEMTRSHTVFIDYQAKDKTELGLKNDKTTVFSKSDDTDITKGCTVEINHEPLLSEYDSHLVPLAATAETVLHKHGQEHLQVTRSHTTAIDCKTVTTRETVGPMDKTVMFVGDHDELEMTRSHTVFIDYQAKDKTELGLKNDKTTVFSKSDDIDITKGCTVEINHEPSLSEHDSHFVPLAGTAETVLHKHGQEHLQLTRSHTTAIDCKTVTTRETIGPIDKTVMFVGDHDELEMTRSHTVFIDYQAKDKTELGLKNDKTTVFSKSDDIDITKGCTVEINHEPSLSEHDSHLVPLAETAETVLHKHGQEHLQLTRSHTTAIDCKTITAKETVRPTDKTIMFVGDHDELEMTRSHTVFIDYQAKDKTELPDTINCELSEKESLKKSKVGCIPSPESIFFPGDCEDGDHLATKQMEVTRCHTTAIDYKTVTTNETVRPTDKTVLFLDDPEELEMTRCHTVFIDYQAKDKTELSLKNDKTIVSSKYDENDMDITKTCTVGIRSTSDLEDRQNSHLLPSALTSKTVLYTFGQNMEITASHTATLQCEPISTDKIATRSLDKTVMFVDNHNELEVTTSKTVFIDCQASEKLLQESNKFGITKSKTMGISYPTNKYSVKEISNKQTLDIEDRIILHKKQNHCVTNFIPPNTLSRSQGEVEIIKSHNSAVDEEVTEKVEDQACKLKNSQLENCQLNGENLGAITKLNSKQVYKLPKDQVAVLVDEHDFKKTFADNDYITFQHNYSTQLLPLLQQEQRIDNEDKTMLSKVGSSKIDTITGNSFVPIHGSESRILDKEQFIATSKNALKEYAQTAKCNTTIDFHSNLDMTGQVVQTHVHTREVSDPITVSNVSIRNIKQDVNHMDGKAQEILDSQTVHIPPSLVPELVNKANTDLNIMVATVKTVSNKLKAEENTSHEENASHNGAEANSAPLTAVVKDKVRRSLGIFLPRLPKKNTSVTGIDDLEQMPADTTDLQHLETQPVSSKNTSTGLGVTKLNLSPSQYIHEENLPTCPGEINSSDSTSIESTSIELEEKTLIETCQKEIPPLENKIEKACSSQKRTWVPEEDDFQNVKKIRKRDISDTTPNQSFQVSDHHTEGGIDNIASSTLVKSLSRTPSSCSSSLDSLKADGTSLDLSTQHNSHMESQFLRDTICEDNLKEKLKDGRITLKEFLMLLQVYTLIQKPRQSSLPFPLTIKTPPTPEDFMLSHHVYRPKIQIYREDRDVLHQRIEELNVSALSQDKLLTDVNKALWEKMRLYSDEELKAFGFYLNKIKSHFTKMTKLFTHQGKVALYRKLVQSVQKENEKLQMSVNGMDNILKKIDNYLNGVEIEMKNLEHKEKDSFIEERDPEVKTTEKELEQLKTEEKDLQSSLLELEIKKKQTLDRIDLLKKQTSETEELLNQLSCSEWDIIEWNDDQAVFTFLYETVELTITFGEQIAGVPFLDKFSRKINDLNFQSLLDEDKAPPSSLLVHKLVFQYIMEQESWKKKCTTQQQVPKMLQEISLVMSRCRLLGEEIEFLKRWGPNYNLMNIDLNHTEVTLLFCSSAAFLKFEITLSLTANYPSVQLPFYIHIHLGDIGKDEITTILSKVPQKDNYLKNVVKQIYQDLLHDCHFSHWTHGPQV